MIASGKVTVNGEVVRRPGTQVDPDTARIEVEGVRLGRHVPRLYLALNKPAGYVSTRRDPHATDTVMDLLLPQLEGRRDLDAAAVAGLHPVGRLDTQTEGLLLLTNDGDFTHALTHPRHGIPKLYLAEVRGFPDETAMTRLRTGVPLFGQRTRPARARVVRRDRGRSVSLVEVELREGRQQQVRQMLRAVGHPVLTLRRTRIGSLELGRLRPGQWRLLTPGEVERLMKEAAPAPGAASEPQRIVPRRPRPAGLQPPEGGYAGSRRKPHGRTR